MRKAQTDLVPCLCCGNDRFRSRVKNRDKYTIEECRRCKLARTVPEEWVTAAEYDQKPEFAIAYAGREALTREYAQMFLGLLRPHVASGRLLDIGCSVGTLVETARVFGFEAEGIDIDRNAVHFGRSMNRLVHCSSLEQWDGQAYDVICLQHTLEHIRDPIGFLRDCRNRLKCGGMIAVSVPCHDGLHPRVFGARWYGWQPDQHYFHFSARAMRRVFMSAGFKVVTIQQNSMDHRVSRSTERFRRAVKNRLMSLVALLGSAIGHGDQLFGVGCHESI